MLMFQQLFLHPIPVPIVLPPTITVTPFAYEDVTVQAVADAIAGIQFNTARTTTPVGDYGTAYDWLSADGAAAACDVMATTSSGALSTGSGSAAAGVWHPLSANVLFKCVQLMASAGTTSWAGTITIRHNPSATSYGALVSIQAIVNATSGGGGGGGGGPIGGGGFDVVSV